MARNWPLAASYCQPKPAVYVVRGKKAKRTPCSGRFLRDSGEALLVSDAACGGADSLDVDGPFELELAGLLLAAR